MKAPREKRDGRLSTVWNQKRGRSECVPMVHKHGLAAACFSPDAERISAFRHGYYVCDPRHCHERDVEDSSGLGGPIFQNRTGCLGEKIGVPL